jgi:DNA-binding NarL/FixJ family response regulator
MVAEATAYRLSSLPGIEVVGCYGVNDRQVAAEAGALAPDVVVVNFDQISGSAIDLLEQLAAVVPSARVIALSRGDDGALAQDMGHSFVSAWIQKDDSLAVLTAVLQSIRRIHRRSALTRGAVLRAVSDDTVKKPRCDNDGA